MANSEDKNEDKKTTNTGEQAQPLVINGQYIKDLSFEVPNAPAIFNKLQDQQPDLNVTVDVAIAKLEGLENTYEVMLSIGAEMKVGDETGFVTELKYGGVFTLNVAEEHVGPMLMIECPRILFPYARNVISGATRDGGFMPLTLQPIDFAAMYQKNLQDSASKK